MCRGAATEDRLLAAGLHRRDVLSLPAHRAVSDSVNPTMNGDQGAALEPEPDLVRGHTGLQHLAASDDTVGAARELSDHLVRGDFAVLEAHTTHKQAKPPTHPLHCPVFVPTPRRVTLRGVFQDLVDQIQDRFAELERQMSDPEVIADRERYAEVGREYRELEPAHALAQEWLTLKDDLEGARELLAEDGDDPELKKVLAEAPGRLEELAEQIRLAMVERDPNDDKNVIVEIRAGTGGDEAALFAGDLYKMLTRYAERRGYSVELLSQSPAEVGGFKEVTFSVKGDGAYSVFKYEGGTHRVQRVPKTESQGRIHTSTATVAVLPEAEEVDLQIDPNDLQIDVYRSSGPGGQSVNTTDSAVRITHKPTGVVVSMQDEKSQLQNREKAMRVLRARLLEREIAEQQAKIASERRAQVGTGERSEKIRTYNFPQDRVTDHRVKLTESGVDRVLGGELDEITDALSSEEKRRRLEAQTAGSAS
jgi:peptide chain release factor 1